MEIYFTLITQNYILANPDRIFRSNSQKRSCQFYRNPQKKCYDVTYAI